MTVTAMMAPMPTDDADLPVIALVRPMLGFSQLDQFALVRLDDTGDLCRLTSVEDPEISFLVVPPSRFFPDYAPVVGDDVVAELGIESVDDVLLLVLNAGESLAATTANLAAPIVVNLVTRRGGQVVLEQPDLPLAAPLLP